MVVGSKNISLIGFMGTGKSSIGKALGRRTGRAVVDIDQRIETDAKRKIRDIFEKEGEAHFRGLEKAMIAETAKLRGVIITTGGGAVLDSENLSALKASGWVIALSASPQTIYERVKDSRHRPLLLQGGEAYAEICRLLELRKPLYAAADREFKTDGLNPEQVAQLIMEFLESADNPKRTCP